MLKFPVAFFLLVLLLSCEDSAVFHRYKPVSGTWHKDSAVTFTLDPQDTLSKHNLFITLRNDNEFGYSNLFLITRMQFPNGRTVTDTLEYEMAAPDGTWLGTGFGAIKENILWYKEDVVFNEPGTYTFSIKQAMRHNTVVDPIEELKGIRDVGLRAEKTE